MADNEQDNAREHLTEREREGLKILAREIVREARLKRDPEEEATREALKSYAESARHINTLAGATAAGATLLYQTLGLNAAWVGPSIVCLLLSLTYSIIATYFTASFLGQPERRDFPMEGFRKQTGITHLLFIVGVFLLFGGVYAKIFPDGIGGVISDVIRSFFAS